MELQIPDRSMWLCIAIGVMLITALIMILQSRYFYTLDVVKYKFSIMDLELPSSPRDLVNIINGIFLLPADDRSTHRADEARHGLRARHRTHRLSRVVAPARAGADRGDDVAGMRFRSPGPQIPMAGLPTFLLT